MHSISSKYHFGLKDIIFLIIISFLLLPNKSHSLDFCKIDNKNYSCPSLSTYNLCENSLTFNGLNFEKGKTNFIKEMKNRGVTLDYCQKLLNVNLPTKSDKNKEIYNEKVTPTKKPIQTNKAFENITSGNAQKYKNISLFLFISLIVFSLLFALLIIRDVLKYFKRPKKKLVSNYIYNKPVQQSQRTQAERENQKINYNATEKSTIVKSTKKKNNYFSNFYKLLIVTLFFGFFASGSSDIRDYASKIQNLFTSTNLTSSVVKKNKDAACKVLAINYTSKNDCLRKLNNRHKLFLERYVQIEGNRAKGTYCKNFSAENMKVDRIIQCIELLESNYRIAQKNKNTKESLELFAKLKDIERKEEIRQRSIDNLTNLGLSLLGYGSNNSSSSNQFTSKSLSFEDKRMNCRRTHDLYFTCRAGNERTQCFIGNPKCKNGTKFSFKDNKMKVGRNFCRYTSDGSYMCN